MKLFYRSIYFIAPIVVILLVFVIVIQKKWPTEKARSTVGSENTTPSRRVYYISPLGDDENDGTSETNAFQTIQKAVDLAQIGETVYLLPGVYLQDIVTKRNGTIGSPITITGPREAVVKGGGRARIFEINHDNITLEGFTIDGLHGDPNKSKEYSNKLIYALGKSQREGVDHLKILSMDIKNAGGECIRLRYFAQENEIAYNNISRCGVFDYRFDGDGKNGEGIYIGTAPEQLKDQRNPTKERDESNSNWIHHNTIDTQGNECVDIKEGSWGNIVEYNTCTGQKDPESGGLDARGSKNILRYNEVRGNVGAGIRLGGDKKSDGIDNEVYGNIIQNNRSGGVKIQREPQGKICGNKMEGNLKGDSVGSYGEDFNPTVSCS